VKFSDPNEQRFGYDVGPGKVWVVRLGLLLPSTFKRGINHADGDIDG
jgi:hypothetical protein